MSEELLSEPGVDQAAILELGVVLGQSHAFGLVAGRCSAAQADNIRRLREEKLFKRCCEKWEEFCPRYLKMSRAEADRIIRLLEEFGPTYFELSQLTRISPESFRAIAPAIQNGVLQHNGEAIPLNSENARKVAAAVAEIRSAIPKKSSEIQLLIAEIDGLGHPATHTDRIAKLDKCCSLILTEFEKLAGNKDLGADRVLLASTLTGMRDALTRLAAWNGLR